MSEPSAQYPYAQSPAPEPPRKNRGRQAAGLAATGVLALAAGAGAGAVLSHGSSVFGSATAASKMTLPVSQIAKRVDPALVDVTSTLGYQGAKAMGTGIVLTSGGEILTNNHVIAGATSISVTDIGNGKTYKATVAGYDESHDVAVLTLPGASGLATATMGDSSSVNTGDDVVALGNAGGHGGTPAVAPGQVAALNQSVTASDSSSRTSENLTDMIETNANVRSGDSGGPLVNGRGQVIGMDTAATSNSRLGGNGRSGSGRSGGRLGGGRSAGGRLGGGSGSRAQRQPQSRQQPQTQGFAIPVSTALSIARQITGGHGSATTHIGPTAFLGLEFSGGSGQHGSGQHGSGAVIAGAAQGTPAAAAGLASGDTVTSVGGHAVSSSSDIQKVLVSYHPGTNITVAWTDPYGHSHTATVLLTSGPAA